MSSGLIMSMQTDQNSEDVMSEINMTPFVDVMLVLLIIFLVTLPVVHQTVNVELPKVSAQRMHEPQEPIRISVDQDGQYHLGKAPISFHQLQQQLALEAQRNPNAIVLLYADHNVRYEGIAILLSVVQKSGLSTIGFVTQKHAQHN